MIIEKAQELGLALSESVEFKRMMEARAALDADENIQKMMQSYTEKRESIVEMMEKEDADKDAMMSASREMEDLQKELLTHPIFIEMLAAQAEFQALMQHVNKTIATCIGMDDPDLESPAAAGCTGSCATCASNCKH